MKDDPHVHKEQGTPDDGGAAPGLDDAKAKGNGHDPNAGKSTAETQKAMLKHALDYAKTGVEVFPIKPGDKIPYKSARWSNGRPWRQDNQFFRDQARLQALAKRQCRHCLRTRQ
jgi:hypothetical protein